MAIIKVFVKSFAYEFSCCRDHHVIHRNIISNIQVCKVLCRICLYLHALRSGSLDVQKPPQLNPKMAAINKRISTNEEETTIVYN